jgi:endoglucanase
MRPEADPNVIYSIHFYEPADLTSLAAWRHDLDRSALARLPFPVDDAAACGRTADHADDRTAEAIRFYCAQHWDMARVRTRLDAAAAWGRTYHVPLLLGEFGASASLTPAARLAWLRAVRQTAEATGMGWTLWGFDDVMGMNVPRPPGANARLDPLVLQALIPTGNARAE